MLGYVTKHYQRLILVYVNKYCNMHMLVTLLCSQSSINMHVLGLYLLQIKLATVQLARKYMKRVAGELDASIASAIQDPQREFLLLQGVRFAFRVHQVN